MKRLFTLFATLALTLSLAACSGQQTASTSPPVSTPDATPPQQSDGSSDTQNITNKETDASTPDAPLPQQSDGSSDTQNITNKETDASTDGESGDPIVNRVTLEDFEKHSGDTEHMKPITEDYFYYQTTNTLDDVVLYQQIHSYDEQGNCSNDAIKTVYSSEAAAKSQYDKPMYDTIRSNLTLDGAVLYQTNLDGCGNIKLDDLDHYLWWQKYGSDTEKEFFSIPIE